MTSLDIQINTANRKRDVKRVAALCKADLEYFVEQQRLQAIAELGPDDDALHLQQPSFRDHVEFWAGVCTAGLTIYVLLVGVFCV